MKKSKKIIITAFILFILDFLLTLYFLWNYDHLVDEGNPLIYIDNGIWVLILNACYFIIIIILAKVLDKYKTVYTDVVSLRSYIKYLFSSEHYKFIFISIIYAFVNASLVSRLIVVIDWLVFGIFKNDFFNTTYYYLRNLMPFGRFDITIGILAFFLFILLWYILEYKKVKINLK